MQNITLVALFGLLLGCASAGETLFIGSADKAKAGIYRSSLQDGTLSEPQRIVPLAGRTQLELSPDRKTLYAAEGTAKKGGFGHVHAFAVGAENELKPLNRMDAGVDHYCSLAVSPDAGHLIGTSFAHGSVGVFRLKGDGSLDERRQLLELPRIEKDGRALSRAHDVEFDPTGRHVFVTDLFSDRVYVFAFDPEPGTLRQTGFVTSKHFEGPRHLIFNRDATVLYVLSQKGSNIVAFRHDGKGGLKEFAHVPTLPADYSGKQNHAAEILVHPGGTFVYSSNRVHDSLVVFGVSDAAGPGGGLQHVQTVPSGGASPWSFVFGGGGKQIVCSNLKSNNLVLFDVDAGTGKLRRHPSAFSVPAPLSLAVRRGGF